MDGRTGIKSVPQFSSYFMRVKPRLYIILKVIKFCHQHSYGFQNLVVGGHRQKFQN